MKQKAWRPSFLTKASCTIHKYSNCWSNQLTIKGQTTIEHKIHYASLDLKPELRHHPLCPGTIPSRPQSIPSLRQVDPHPFLQHQKAGTTLKARNKSLSFQKKASQCSLFKMGINYTRERLGGLLASTTG